MKRNAFTMRLKKGCESEYKKRHDKIWTGLVDELKKAGISDYSIYLDEDTGTLFAFQKLSDDNTAALLPEKPIMRKWWDYMKDLMDTNPDGSPVCVPLKEVFHID